MNLNEIRRLAGLPYVAENYVEAKKPEGEDGADKKPEDGADKKPSLADSLKDLPSVNTETDKAAEYFSKLVAANVSFAVVPGKQVAFYFATQEDADKVKLDADNESDEQPQDKE